MSSVLLLGDSNGRRYYNALSKIFQQVGGYNCVTVKDEPRDLNMPNAVYYAQGTNISVDHIVVHQRDCFSCNNILSRCIHPNTKPVMLEYLNMELLIDTEVTTRRDPTLHQSNTYQEFIFEEYLPGTARYYPDIIVIFGNSHEFFRNKLVKTKDDLMYLLRIIQRSVPQSTRVVWIPVHAHYSEEGKYINWEKLAAINRVWFETSEASHRQRVEDVWLLRSAGIVAGRVATVEPRGNGSSSGGCLVRSHCVVLIADLVQRCMIRG